jgi:hypothetical protein
MPTTRLHTLAARARRTWRELDYVQRRLFEIQTGIPLNGSRHRTARYAENRAYGGCCAKPAKAGFVVSGGGLRLLGHGPELPVV